MPATALRKIVAWWGLLLLLAILNGALRELLLMPAVGLVTAQVMSGAILAFLILLLALIAVPGLRLQYARQYWMVGGLWLAMTLVFEFGFGLLVQQQPLSRLLAAYTFRDGNLWPLVLVFTLASPRLAARLRGLV